MDGSTDQAAERRLERGRVAGGVAVLDRFRVPPLGTAVVVGGIEDREAVDLALVVRGGLEDGITRILERVMVSFAGGVTAAADALLDPGGGSIVLRVASEAALLNLRFLAVGLEASV
jgi:hypothetical protein